MRRLDQEAGLTFISLNFRYFDAAANRSSYLLCIGDEIVRNLLLGDEGIGICIGKFYARKSIMPRRTVGYQRVPSFGAPAFCNAVPLEDDMRHAAFAQMLAHRQPGLATAHNDRFNFFNGHVADLFPAQQGTLRTRGISAFQSMGVAGSGELCFHGAMLSLGLNV